MIINRFLKKTGEVPAFSANQIRESFWGIGFEKLDRNVFDPEKAYDKLAAIGVKYIRLQSGWMRTESVKGVYDFAWLDAIVDNLIKRGMIPWMCLCYGNPLYGGQAEVVYGAVGCPPIKTQEEREAWHRYVAAVTAHFKGRVSMYEVWNEPDGEWCWKHGVNGTEYGEFLKATAAAIREGDPDAKVLGGAMCGSSWNWLDAALKTGAGECMDYFSYHGYTPNELGQPQRIRSLRALLHKYGLDHVQLIQGETGSPSRDDGYGALHNGAWTQERQAKVLLRLMFQHMALGVKFSSYFTTVDMIEALNGTVGNKASYLDYGYFGVLSADFDENGFSTGEYSPKISYRALQTIAAMFREMPEVTNDVLVFACELAVSPRTFRMAEDLGKQTQVMFRRADGSAAFVYWHPSDPLINSVDTVMDVLVMEEGEMRLVDLMDGTIYELSDEMVTVNEDGSRVIKGLPLRDHPLALVFGNFF